MKTRILIAFLLLATIALPATIAIVGLVTLGRG